jgi:hypothetical protein
VFSERLLEEVLCRRVSRVGAGNADLVKYGQETSHNKHLEKNQVKNILPEESRSEKNMVTRNT